MDQKKVGGFLKELRKEKGITQEMLAEKLNVSGRTVSRWETGSNMPDISLLIELAELYDVSIPEIVNGERKSENMNEEVKEVAQTLSTYATAEKESLIVEIRKQSILGSVALFVYLLLDYTGMSAQNTFCGHLENYCLTLICITPVMILLYTTGVLEKTRKNKEYSKGAKFLIMVVACLGAFGLAYILNLLGL